jgi:predicted DCC family thiol-disulfide oxidoreductase YuxK
LRISGDAAGALSCVSILQQTGRDFSYREDPSVPDFPDDRPIIIFDGHCILCSRGARFILRHDRRAVFRLMTAQSRLGQAIYRHLNLDPVNFETYVLLEDGCAWLKSAATIRILAHLGFPWSVFRVLQLVPHVMLDRLYDLLARNRFRLFGSQSTCFLADPAHQDRFLE